MCDPRPVLVPARLFRLCWLLPWCAAQCAVCSGPEALMPWRSPLRHWSQRYIRVQYGTAPPREARLERQGRVSESERETETRERPGPVRCIALSRSSQHTHTHRCAGCRVTVRGAAHGAMGQRVDCGAWCGDRSGVGCRGVLGPLRSSRGVVVDRAATGAYTRRKMTARSPAVRIRRDFSRTAVTSETARRQTFFCTARLVLRVGGT